MASRALPRAVISTAGVTDRICEGGAGVAANAGRARPSARGIGPVQSAMPTCLPARTSATVAAAQSRVIHSGDGSWVRAVKHDETAAGFQQKKGFFGVQ
eukprot:scaffold677714_cov32-Prasinocladus_malaysianus.AAC.1